MGEYSWVFVRGLYDFPDLVIIYGLIRGRPHASDGTSDHVVAAPAAILTVLVIRAWLYGDRLSADRHCGVGQVDLISVSPGSSLDTFPLLNGEGGGLDDISKPYKPFLPTSYSPQEGYLKEGEDMLSIKELWRNVADYSKRNEENHERPQTTQLDDASIRDTRKEGLFQHFYQVVQKERDRERPSDCVIVYINNEQREYATGIGHRLQDHDLVVEMIHLSSESSLMRALQEVKDDGSPFCILVEQSNVKLSSCTVIMLHESIKSSFSSLVHRHMPLEDALVLVAKEYRRFFSKREQQERTRVALRAGDLVDDFLARERLTSYSVPSDIQHLLFLLTEGKHLYGNELNLLIDYLTTRKGQLEGFETPESLASNHSSFQGRNTPVVGKLPPLLPTPGKQSFPGSHLPLPAKSPLLGDRPGGALLPPPGLVNPKGLFAPPLLPAAISKRPAPMGCPQPKCVKRPLLGEKPGLLVPPTVLLSVLHKQAVQPMSLLN
ncbi:uncharacterized protein [Canis lupus baileyi]|uniref:uncharacterized protein n=1 Tax=Canis lupus baileyi TaxID=143281 RepID=UPI003B970B3F